MCFIIITLTDKILIIIVSIYFDETIVSGGVTMWFPMGGHFQWINCDGGGDGDDDEEENEMMVSMRMIGLYRFTNHFIHNRPR